MQAIVHFFFASRLFFLSCLPFPPPLGSFPAVVRLLSAMQPATRYPACAVRCARARSLLRARTQWATSAFAAHCVHLYHKQLRTNYSALQQRKIIANALTGRETRCTMVAKRPQKVLFTPCSKVTYNVFRLCLGACLNFAQPSFEDCFQGYFPVVVRSVAGYVTRRKQGKRPKKAQKKLNKKT